MAGDSVQAPGGPGRFYLAATLAVLAWIVFHLGWMTGPLFAAPRFILGDQGSYLYAVGRWQAGEALYRDFAWQYGPLALGWYRAFAAIGGNTPLTLVLASSIAFAVAWVLVARLVVRVAGWRWGGGFAVAGLLPLMSASGLFALNGAHGAIEMLLLVLIAWTLSRPGPAGAHPWQLGILAGLLHWVRFGPHVVALLGIMVITAWQCRARVADRRALARQLAAFAWRLFVAYAVVVVPLVIWFFKDLPAAGAWEQLWPAHMKAHYAATYPNRWPQISSAGVFVMRWLPALTGVGLAFARLVIGFRRRDLTPEAGRPDAMTGLIFLSLHYALSCAVLFQNDHAIRGHLWLGWPALALGARLAPRWGRLAVALAVAPAMVSQLADYGRLVKEERVAPRQPVTMPNGQRLWFSPVEMREFGALQAALGPAPQGRRVAVFLAGGGVHHFFGTQRVGRLWWFLPEFVRPWEAPVVEADLLRNELILVADRGQMAAQTRTGPVTLWLPLPPAMAQRMAPHLGNPRQLDGVGVLLDVRP